MQRSLVKLLLFTIVGTFALIANISAFGQESPQTSVASTTAKFSIIPAAESVVANAIMANDLNAAAKLKGKQGAFKGTVAKVFVPKSGAIVILNFDRNYKNALTAVVKKSNFSKFPDLNSLDGKFVVITGKFVEYRGAIEIELTDPDQIRIIE